MALNNNKDLYKMVPIDCKFNGSLGVDTPMTITVMEKMGYVDFREVADLIGFTLNDEKLKQISGEQVDELSKSIPINANASEIKKMYHDFCGIEEFKNNQGMLTLRRLYNNVTQKNIALSII